MLTINAPLPDCVLLRLEGAPPPPVETAYRLGLRLRAAVLGHAGALFPGVRPPAVLAGHEMAGNGRSVRAEGHRHAFYLPLDVDGDGNLDTIAVTARAGFDRTAASVLTTLADLRAGTLGRWEVCCFYLGPGQLAPVRLCGPAAVWVSATPFFNPMRRHRCDLKPTREEEQRYQLTHLLDRQGYPPRRLEGLSGPAVSPSPYLANDGLTEHSSPDRTGGRWRITFETMVPGPLALGHGAHQGLGLFVPDQS